MTITPHGIKDPDPLRQEIEAYAQHKRIDPNILQVLDWQNAQENTLRRTILGAYRGYGRKVNSKRLLFHMGVGWKE